MPAGKALAIARVAAAGFRRDDAHRNRTVPGTLFPPAGNPDSACGVVVCGSLTRTAPLAAALSGRGIPTLCVDSTAVRRPSSAPAAAATMVADAFAGARTLHTTLSGDAPRLVLLGIGDVADQVLLCAYRQVIDRFAPAAPFVGHIALGGRPRFRLVDYRTSGAPVVIEALPAHTANTLTWCHLVAEDLRRGGSPVDEHLMPGPIANSTPHNQMEPDGGVVADTTGRPVGGLLSRILAPRRGADASTPPDADTVLSLVEKVLRR